ncbi:MAG TPA: DJ-1/PfpI family protein [Kineosporiaceae bacterium]|nr:DJ-1/PfpI family protein [Kineosporiaceae bacterium]
MRIEIVVFDGYDELDAFGPFEVLAVAAGQGAPFEVVLVGLEGPGEVRGIHGSRVLLEVGLGTPDAVIVPGGGWLNRAPSGAFAEAARGVLTERLAALAPDLRWTASVCTGAMLLAAAGLLKGRPATTNRAALAELRAGGAIVQGNRVVDDGNVITSGGLSAGLDLGLWLIEREVDADLARNVADILEYRPHNDVWQSRVVHAL